MTSILFLLFRNHLLENHVKIFTKLLSISTLIVGILNPSFIMAAEEEKEKKEKTENIRDGAYLDIGISQVYQSDPFKFDNDNENDNGLQAAVNGRYQKYGFFVELRLGASEQEKSRLALGYNFLNTEHWSYDFRIATNHRTLEHTLPQSSIVSTRKSFLARGLRILGDYDNTQLRFIIAESSGTKGLYAGGWLSQNYQYNNLNLYSAVGIEYRNEDVINHFYGINEVEGLAYYRGESGFEYTGQVGFGYPITTDWVFEGFARIILLPSGITNSPLVDGNTITEAAVSVKYVF
jgi:outer membrane protein